MRTHTGETSATSGPAVTGDTQTAVSPKAETGELTAAQTPHPARPAMLTRHRDAEDLIRRCGEIPDEIEQTQAPDTAQAEPGPSGRS